MTLQLQTLDLSGNELSNVTALNFHGLKVLEILLLSSNKLTTIDPQTFERLLSLKRLDLRRNSIILPEPQPGFLVQHSLEILNLDNCNLESIPEATFVNMPQLQNLTLSGNSFSVNIDVDAFDWAKDLTALRISNLSETTTYSLCEKLTTIDTIQFDGYYVSCVILSDDDNSFEDAVFKNLIEEQPRNDSEMSSPNTTRKPTKAPSKSTLSSAHVSQEFSTTSTGSPMLNETLYESATNKTKIDTETASIDIENETIKYILIGEFKATFRTLKLNRQKNMKIDG